MTSTKWMNWIALFSGIFLITQLVLMYYKSIGSLSEDQLGIKTKVEWIMAVNVIPMIVSLVGFIISRRQEKRKSVE